MACSRPCYRRIQDGKKASKSFGKASLDPPTPCTPDTLFDIASSSKSMTAASVAMLCADNDKYPHVRWETVMSSLLPEEFVMSNENHTNSVTVEDVLSHRTGLPRHDDSYLGVRAEHPDNAKSVTMNLRNLPVSAPVRSKYMYCNMMYTVAAYLVAEMSGLTFADFLHQHFYQPLGMHSTHLQPDATRAAGLGHRITTPYVWKDEDRTFQAVELQQCPEGEGAGSIFTSVNDYINYIEAMLHRKGPISETMYENLIKPRISTSSDDEDDDKDPHTSEDFYAAGWSTHYYRSHLVVEHGGAIPGFGSTHFFLPEFAFGGVILGNASGADDLADILAHMLIDSALGVPEEERPDWAALIARRVERAEEKEDQAQRELRQSMRPELQSKPLTAYKGRYWNAGYRGLNVQIREERLFVDATDRGFWVTFEHVAEQREYVARLRDYYEGGEDLVAAEFGFEGEDVVRVGLRLEEELEGLVWFDRVDGRSRNEL